MITHERQTFILWDRPNKRKITVDTKRISAHEWRGLCPFHADSEHPNLDVNDLKRMYICRACHVGGPLYEPGFENKKKPIQDIYNYEDEKGELIYQVVRYEGKDFKQRRPDGAGGWIWNLKGVKKILFNLPELVQKPGNLVFIPEGEKDCLNLKKLGILATTNSGGSGQWPKGHNKYFKDREVIIPPDKDDTGENHLQIVGKDVMETAKRIRVLRLPGLSKGEDISDWIERGGTLEELFELLKTAPEFIPQKEEVNESKKKKKEETKKERTRTIIPGLIHLVKEGEHVGYLLQNSGNFYIDESFTGEDGTICKPKSDLPIYYCGADILREPREIDYSLLLDDVIKYIKSYLELPKGKESNYLILGLWVFQTYLIENMDITPLIYFYGVYETGKSRAGEVLKELGFRCETITSPTEAVLFRGASYFKGALIVDQVKIWGSEGNKDIATLIKARYKRGLMVPRINLNKSGEDQIEYFDTFGPMVICTDETMPQDIESRCITFQMQKNNDPGVEGALDKDLAKSIRNRLIVFRANLAGKELKELEPISRRRLNEILYPLYQVLMEIAPERRDEFKLIIKEIEKKKEGEEGFTLEADIVNEIVKYYNETKDNSFLTSEIVTRLNEDKRERDQFSNMLVSLRVKRLGFEKIRLAGGRMGYKIDLDLLEKIIPHYKVVEIEKVEKGKTLFPEKNEDL